MGRTSVIKNLDEMYWYAVGESSSNYFAKVIVTDTDTVEIREKDGYASGNTDDLIVFPKYSVEPGAKRPGGSLDAAGSI